jgi:hypothetical protein
VPRSSVDGPTQVDGQLQAPRDVAAQCLVEHLDAVAAQRPGAAHRRLRVVQQRARTAVSVGDRDADAGGHVQLDAAGDLRGADGPAHASRDLLRHPRIVQAGQTTANRSPLMRARTSLSRTMPDRRSATPRRASSPAS